MKLTVTDNNNYDTMVVELVSLCLNNYNANLNFKHMQEISKKHGDKDKIITSF